MRSGVLVEVSAGAGITLVGVLSALMIGGSPLFGSSDIGAIGERGTRADDGERQHRGNRQQTAALADRLGLVLVAVLIGVGIVGIGGLALIILRASLSWP